MQRDIAKLRLENAKALIATAKSMIEIGDYKSAANRSYYAVFNAMRAELALLKIDHKKHTSVISDFRLKFIKTGIFNTEMSDIITRLFYVRNQSDYNDFYVISKEEVTKQTNNAELFVLTIAKHLEQAD